MESILNSIKKLIGPSAVYNNFDTDLIIHINSVFTILHQLGVGPSEGYRITSEHNTWDEFIPDDIQIELVKTYVYLKVKLIFDPPDRAAVLEAMNNTIIECECRLQMAAELAQKNREEV